MTQNADLMRDKTRDTRISDRLFMFDFINLSQNPMSSRVPGTNWLGPKCQPFGDNVGLGKLGRTVALRRKTWTNRAA